MYKNHFSLAAEAHAGPNSNSIKKSSEQRRNFIKMAAVGAGTLATAGSLTACGAGINEASAQTIDGTSEAIISKETALIVMHYQTDILNLFPSVAPTLVTNTRILCDAARAKGIQIYFVKIQFSPGYPEVSSMNKNGEGLKALGLFISDTISPGLGQQANEPLIQGHRVSVFYGTDLQVRLDSAGINTLIMVGIASTGVVLSSVAYASAADYRLFTVKDCCYDPDTIVNDHLFTTAFESRTNVLSLADAITVIGAS